MFFLQRHTLPHNSPIYFYGATHMIQKLSVIVVHKFLLKCKNFQCGLARLLQTGMRLFEVHGYIEIPCSLMVRLEILNAFQAWSFSWFVYTIITVASFHYVVLRRH